MHVPALFTFAFQKQHNEELSFCCFQMRMSLRRSTLSGQMISTKLGMRMVRIGKAILQ